MDFFFFGREEALKTRSIALLILGMKTKPPEIFLARGMRQGEETSSGIWIDPGPLQHSREFLP